MWNPFKRRAAAVQDSEEAQLHWQFSAAMLSDVGCVRRVNEDTGRFLHLPSRHGEATQDLLGVIADGMGGHQAGEIASQLAVDEVCRTYAEEGGLPGPRLESAMIAANRAVYNLAAGDERLSGMGTTCTGLALCDGFAYMAHVGDSRLYLIRDGAIYQMTEDHTHVMELVRRGLITAEQAREHPDRNVLHRALGRHASIEVAQWAEGHALQDGDRYLLCSDGLSGVLQEDVIGRVAVKNTPAEACAALIDLTRRAGAPDNVTVGIVSVTKDTRDVAEMPATREIDVAEGENGDYRPELK